MPEIVRKNPVNDPTQKPVKNHSKFQPNYSIYQTPIFGLATPFFGMAGVGDDHISMRLGSDMDTMSLQAPTMSPINKSFDYFMLPVRCLLPRGAELLITNPLRGDDIVAKDVNAVISKTRMSTDFANFSNLGQFINTLSTSIADVKLMVQKWLHWIQLGGLLFSRASMMRNLGYSLDDLVFITDTTTGDSMYFDDIVEDFFKTLRQQMTSNNIDNFDVTWLKFDLVAGVYTPNPFTKRYGTKVSATVHSIEEFIYDLLTMPFPVAGSDDIAGLFWDSGQSRGINFFTMPQYFSHSAPTGYDINVLRCVAYQKACAEFYSVDTVDDVYSAKLWEDNQLELARNLYSTPAFQYYQVNGTNIQYDACAGKYLSTALYLTAGFINSGWSQSVMSKEYASFAYLHNLFGYSRTLRYQDYFVGSRVAPLAVGDVTVGVSANSFNVVENIYKTQVARFLNQVNRVGRKWKDYLKGVLGTAPLTDAHEPIFLAHVSSTVGAEETQNTGADQFSRIQSKTANFRSNDNRFGFVVNVAEPSVIIGIQTYDLPRVYGSGNDRENYHLDRYDAFNPFLQFVGDQPVYQHELLSYSAGTMGYQLRYAEYKQRVSRAAGGFLSPALEGYAKVLDQETLVRKYGWTPEISSEFIRAHCNDIDQFYLNRSFNCFRDAYHFIVRNDMEVDANRPMVFAPSLL